MHLSALHLYPVKSCRGLSVPTAELDDYGLVGDRRFLVVNAADGKFLTQRSHPRMALIETALSADTLTLTSAGHGSIAVPFSADFGPREVTVWKNTMIADDCGDAPAEWLSRFLGGALRLVHLGARYHRAVSVERAGAGHAVSFADGFPFLIVSEASLANLNARLAVPLPMDRFRPNFVVTGCAPHAEDTWQRYRIGELVFRNIDACARCPITTTDQLTAERGKEPLKTFATYRRDPRDHTDVIFGYNVVHETKRGTLRVGDPLTLL
ncbi:MAG: MOSC N-terminal beta barrel domain-containing protein [Opitutae bacterium]|nr:MOSC N-terminal beta barrel domain-containing protein [Opitutae bacterium]